MGVWEAQLAMRKSATVGIVRRQRRGRERRDISGLGFGVKECGGGECPEGVGCLVRGKGL